MITPHRDHPKINQYNYISRCRESNFSLYLGTLVYWIINESGVSFFLFIASVLIYYLAWHC